MGTALKCYTCSNCGDDIGEIDECSSSDNVCLKFHIQGLITKGCTRKELCSLNEVQRGFNTVWNKVKNVFLEETTYDKSKDVVNCCETSYCNGGNTRSSNLGLSSALLFGLIMVYIQG